MTVSGYNLVNPYTYTAPPLTCGSGMEFTYTSGDCTGGSYAIFNYSIAPTTSPGVQDFCAIGSSNSVPFTVNYDPTPSISSITPSPWQAGWNNQLITISGSGFGTNPTLTIGDSTITCTGMQASDPGPPATAQITCYLTVPANDLSTSTTVKVTSNSYGGSIFLMIPQGGGATSPTKTVGIAPVPAPPAQIFLGPNTEGDGICVDSNATNITNSTRQVVVGQQIACTACIPDLLLAQLTQERKGVRYPFFFRRKRGRIRSWVESGDWRSARWFTTR